MKEPCTLLTIDDEEAFRRSIRGYFEDSGFEVLEARDGQEGLAIFRDRHPEVVLVDLAMPGVSGLQVIETLVEESPGTPLVVLSGTGVMADALDAIRKGAWDYVMKPVINMAALEHVVQNVLERARLLEEKRRYEDHLEDEVFWRTQEISALNERLKAVVRSSRSVMVCTSTTEVARQLLEEFASNLVAQDCRLYMPENGHLVLKHVLDTQPAMTSIPLPVPATSLFGRVLDKRLPVLVPSVTADAGISCDGVEAFKGGSLLAFPIISSPDESLGVILLHKKTDPPFSERDLEIGALLASYGSEAIRAARATESLKASEKQFRELVENMNEGLFRVDLDGRITYLSPVIKSMTGYRPEEVLGRDFREFVAPRQLNHVEKLFREVLTGAILQAEFEVRKKSGEFLWTRVSGRPVFKGECVAGIQGSLADISDRKAAEIRLERRAFEQTVMNELMRDLGFDLTVGNAVRTALKHVIRAVEPDVAMLFLLEDGQLILKGLLPEGKGFRVQDFPPHHAGECLCGLAISERTSVFSSDIHTDLRCTLRECREAGLSSFGALPLLSAGEIIGVLGVASNHQRNFADEAAFLETLSSEIAIGLKNNLLYHRAENYALELQARLAQIEAAEEEKTLLTRQLNQAQKMEAIGTLAGGIAHDFNNILSAIIGFTEMTRLKVDQPPLRRHLDHVLNACERARNLVAQILAFSRATELELKPVDISFIAKEAVKLLRATIPSIIEIRFKSAANIHTVRADPTRIHQVLINLCTNAAHAMREKGGVLEVELENIEITAGSAPTGLDVKPGPCVVLTVRDSGIGIPPDVMHRIFDPFFTTKEKGEGTGLGLSVVYGIVKGFGGSITVDSQPGAGATFKVYLPAITDMAEVRPETEEPLVGGREHILFIDDEEMLMEMGRYLLEELGYRVTPVADSTKALELFRAQPGQFDLVITDMTMPGMTGADLAREMLKLRPDLPIILCTGLSEIINEEKAMAMGIREFVMKPLNLRKIAELTRKALGTRPRR